MQSSIGILQIVARSFEMPVRCSVSRRSIFDRAVCWRPLHVQFGGELGARDFAEPVKSGAAHLALTLPPAELRRGLLLLWLGRCAGGWSFRRGLHKRDAVNAAILAMLGADSVPAVLAVPSAARHIADRVERWRRVLGTAAAAVFYVPSRSGDRINDSAVVCDVRILAHVCGPNIRAISFSKPRS